MTSPCAGCFLRNRSRVPCVGPIDAKLAVWGEAPAHNEVREKRPFVGQSGQDLNIILGSLGVRRDDLRIGNALLCGPITEDDKKLPEFKDALARCRERRELEGDLGDIRHVLALGVNAGEGLLAERIVYGGRQPRRGALVIDPKGRYVTTSWHPAAMRRAGGDSTKQGKKGGGGLSDAEIEILATDVEKAWAFANGRRAVFEPDGVVTTDSAVFVEWIRQWTTGAQRVSIDIETDSVNPIEANLLVVGLAVTDAAGVVHGVTFWWPGASEAAWTALRELLARPGVVKAFHNLQYDVSVLERIVGPIAGPFYDTMLSMHAAFPEVKVDLGSTTHTFLVVPAWKYYFRAWERMHKKDVEAKSDEWKLRHHMYNLWDVTCTEALVPHLDRECEDRKVSHIAQLDTRLALVARKMTERGLLLSPTVRDEIRTELTTREAHAAEKLRKLVVESCENALAVGMRVDLVEKLMLLVQKSSNKSVPKPRWRQLKRKASRPARRRKKLSAAAQAAIDLLTAEAAAAPTSAPAGELEASPFDETFIAAHAQGLTLTVSPEKGVVGFEPASIGPGQGSPPEVEAAMGAASPSAKPSAEAPAPDSYVDWIKSAPAGAQVGPDGRWLFYPPVPDKVWTNKAWNPFSTDQLRLAFDISGVDLPAGALTKKGQRSLSKHVLVQVFDHPLVGAVIELRKYRRLLSVYFESKGVQLGEDWRLRVGWKIHGTPNGRWSSGAGGGGVGDIGIAVQNWPSEMRKMVVPAPQHKLVGADYCVDPATQILRRDLTWCRADELRVGEELVAFEECLGLSSRLIPTKVEAISFLEAESYCVETDCGSVICSGDHRWPITRPCVSKTGKLALAHLLHKRIWMPTSEIRTGDMLPFLVEPWEIDQSREAAYLAGFLDGEGSVARAWGRAGFGQNPGTVTDYVETLLRAKGFEFHHTVSRSGCRHYHFVGSRTAMRLLGTLRPVRLGAVSDRTWLGQKWARKVRKAIVRSIKPLGPRRVVGVRTAAGTFIANGFFSHNSQLEMRVAAVLSGETALLDVFNDPTGGRDMHSENAARLYGATWASCDPFSVIDTVHGGVCDKAKLKAIQKLRDAKLATALIAEQIGNSEQFVLQVLDYAGRRKLIRKFTKTGIYAAFYGAAPPTVQSQLRAMSLKETDPKFSRMLREVSLKQCQMFVDAVPRMWPRFARWRSERMNSRTGVWVCPWSGRRRVWPMGRADGPQLINTSVQMGAASAMNDRFLIFAEAAPPDVHLILQVHDSIVAEAPASIAEDVKKLMIQTMEMTLELNGYRVRLTVEADVGDSWDKV